MYKILISALCLCMLTSCQQEEIIYSCSPPTHFDDISDYDFFIHDANNSAIYNSMIELTEMDVNRPSLIDKFEEIKNQCCFIIDKYGIENTFDFLERAIIDENYASTSNGACCSLLDEGQNVWACCGKWKSIKVVFVSTSCYSNSNYDLNDINEWLEKVWDALCDVC